MLQSLDMNYNYIAAHLLGNEVEGCMLGKKCFTLVRNLYIYYIYIYEHELYTLTYKMPFKLSELILQSSVQWKPYFTYVFN
jgi:hypothetical protein